MRVTLFALLVLALVAVVGPARDARSAGVGESPLVTVYGADGESFTEKMRNSLERSGLPFVYRVHDEGSSADDLQSALQAAGITRCCPKGCAYKLPVVTVDAMLMVSPKPAVVKSAYQRAR